MSKTAIDSEILPNALGTVIMPILQIRKPMLCRTYVSQDLNLGSLSPEPELIAPLLNRGSRACSVYTQL